MMHWGVKVKCGSKYDETIKWAKWSNASTPLTLNWIVVPPMWSEIRIADINLAYLIAATYQTASPQATYWVEEHQMIIYGIRCKIKQSEEIDWCVYDRASKALFPDGKYQSNIISADLNRLYQQCAKYRIILPNLLIEYWVEEYL